MTQAFVAILIPSGDLWQAKFGLSLISACAELMVSGLAGYTVMNKRGSILPQLREKLVEDALGRGDVTHLLFIDSDQTFPSETIVELLRAKREVVALNIPVKRLPAWPTARRLVDGKLVPVYSRPTTKRYGEVDAVGMGVMMLKAEVFDKIEKPWFGIGWAEDTQDFIGEDWFLCKRLRDARIPIFVDHHLSRKVGHVGAFEFTHEHIDEHSGCSEAIQPGARLVAVG